MLSEAATEDADPMLTRCGAADITTDTRFILTYSVSAMEPFAVPRQVIARIAATLSPGGRYRFLCPKYLFPYKPHFNIPTIGSKAHTWSLMRHRVEENCSVGDPTGLRESLDWITVPPVRRHARSMGSVDLSFRRSSLTWMLGRAVNDPQFARRRARWMISIIGAAKTLGVLRLASLVPPLLQPIMDVSLVRRA